MKDLNTKLEELEDAIFPILLNAVNNNLTLKEACNAASISYDVFKKTLKQIDLAHKHIQYQTTSKIKTEIQLIEKKLQLAMECKATN